MLPPAQSMAPRGYDPLTVITDNGIRASPKKIFCLVIFPIPVYQ